MPRYNNSFRAPEYYEEVIVDGDGIVIGTIRVKPSSVLWKPRNARKYFSVSLETFADWIEAESTKARRTKN